MGSKVKETGEKCPICNSPIVTPKKGLSAGIKLCINPACSGYRLDFYTAENQKEGK